MIGKHFVFIIVIILFQFGQFAMADHPHGITEDGLLNTEVSFDGNVYHISKGTGRGNNLFHSFEKFNLHQNESAIFNDSGYQNTISRVTGADYSWINGQITSAAENFYLLNPNGVLFGSMASLDVAGSFHVSTCDYMSFHPNEKFYTSGLETSVLSSAPPSSFGFLDHHVGPVSMDNSVLMVSDHKTISLIGGKIDSSYGYLYAPSGQIHIAGVNSPGLVTISSDSLTVSSEIKNDISFMGTYVEVSGNNPGKAFVSANNFLATDFTYFLAEHTGTNGTGTFSVEANNIDIVDSGFYATTYGDGNAGEISLYALENINISGLQSNLDVSAQMNSSGKAGNILISANTLFIDDAAMKNQAEKNTGGMIKIQATGDITINKGLFELRTTDFDGSHLFISGNNIFINGGKYLMGTSSAGNAGKLEIIASETMQLSDNALIDANTDAIFSPDANDHDGNAGDISLIAGNDLILKDNVKITSSVTHMSHGNGGKILLQAGAALTLQGNDYENRVQINVNNYDKYNAYFLLGNAGALEMRAKHISLLDYVRIDASTSYLNYNHVMSDPSNDLTNPYENDNKGKGGLVDLCAEETITLKGKGAPHLIPIEIVPNRNHMWDKKVESPVHIDMSSYGTGHAGELKMESSNISIGDDVKIDGYAGFIGNGPTIRFNASETLLLHGTKEPVYFETIINNKSFDTWAFPVDIALTSEWRAKSGELYMRAKNIFLKDYVTINLNSYATTTARSGDIYINAQEDFRFEGIVNDHYQSKIDISCLIHDTFDFNILDTYSLSGKLFLNANNISISNALIVSKIGDWNITCMGGKAGEISLNANNSIHLNNTIINNFISARFDFLDETRDNSISLSGNEVVMNNTTIAGTTTGYIPGGKIIITGRNRCIIDNQSSIKSESYLNNDKLDVDNPKNPTAGEIYIHSPVFELNNDSLISVVTYGIGDAGKIEIKGVQDNEVNEKQTQIHHACNMVRLSNKSHIASLSVLTNAEEKSGDAGDIIIASKNLVLDHSYILSASDSSGKGGRISIGKKLLINHENNSVSIMEQGDLISLQNSTITTAGQRTISDQAGNIELG